MANAESPAVNVDEEDEFTLYWLSPAHCDPPLEDGGVSTVADKGPRVDPWGDSNATTPRGALPVTPGARGGANGCSSSTGDPAGRPQGPDPLPGRRTSIRPQPTRAPRGEAMAPSPLQGEGLAWAVAGGPTPEWGGGGMARGTAVMALRLPLAPSVFGKVPRGSSPPTPLPLGGTVATGRADDEHRLSGERRGMHAQSLGAKASPRRPKPAQVAPRQEEAKGSAP